MEPHLRLQIGQRALTPEQEAEARRFAAERIAVQLSTEPVEEPEAEWLLRQAYAMASVPPPQQIGWVDGPLQLVALLPPRRVRESLGASVQASAWDRKQDNVVTHVQVSLHHRVRHNVKYNVWNSVRDCVEIPVQASVVDPVWSSVVASVRESVGESVATAMDSPVWASVAAYLHARWLAVYRFFDIYLTPNDAHALACFNERVSGYWLGAERAVLVRRPKVLERDQEGRLHSATGKCLEYHDGWGFYAWHGVRVPERVILNPDSLIREDFLNASNVEVRRVIQERMGSRFVREVGGVVIDASPRGTLYEVALPADDPERVARFVQVQDASTSRQYVLRVPPTIQTAAEAVAWSFGLSVEEYQPVQET